LLCYIILSSSGNYQPRYKQLGRISSVIAGETSSTSIRFLRTNCHLLAVTLFAICILFSSPALLKRFCKKYKNIFRLPFPRSIVLFACVLVYVVMMSQENTKLCDFSNTSNNDFSSTSLLLPPLVRSLMILMLLC